VDVAVLTFVKQGIIGYPQRN